MLHAALQRAVLAAQVIYENEKIIKGHRKALEIRTKHLKTLETRTHGLPQDLVYCRLKLASDSMLCEVIWWCEALHCSVGHASYHFSEKGSMNLV